MPSGWALVATAGRHREPPLSEHADGTPSDASWGVVGALVAVPTAALLSVLMDEYIVHKDWKEPSLEP